MLLSISIMNLHLYHIHALKIECFSSYIFLYSCLFFPILSYELFPWFDLLSSFPLSLFSFSFITSFFFTFISFYNSTFLFFNSSFVYMVSSFPFLLSFPLLSFSAISPFSFSLSHHSLLLLPPHFQLFLFFS